MHLYADVHREREREREKECDREKERTRERQRNKERKRKRALATDRYTEANPTTARLDSAHSFLLLAHASTERAGDDLAPCNNGSTCVGAKAAAPPITLKVE